jgi:hypothetical protein
LVSDDAAFARHLVTDIGVASVPGSSFIASAAGRTKVRFCFCKKDETLSAAVRAARRAPHEDASARAGGVSPRRDANGIRLRGALRSWIGRFTVAAACWCAAGQLTVVTPDSASARFAIPAPGWCFVVGLLIGCAALMARKPRTTLPALLTMLPWLPVPRRRWRSCGPDRWHGCHRVRGIRGNRPRVTRQRRARRTNDRRVWAHGSPPA